MKQLPQKIFVAGIGTGVGKTIAAAILAEALEADYWKPVQCGDLDSTDTSIVQSLVSNPVSKFFHETYRFQTPSAPHYAALMEGIEINPQHFITPESQNRLLIEGAGGLMVPISNDYLVVDLIKHLGASVILVSKSYLGSINHTLMSIEVLRSRGVEITGIIYNGENIFDNEEIIHRFTNIPVIGKITVAEKLDKAFIRKQAEMMKVSLLQHYLL